jgi:hypothetical protein
MCKLFIHCAKIQIYPMTKKGILSHMHPFAMAKGCQEHRRGRHQRPARSRPADRQMTYNGVSGGQYPYDINAGVMAKIASMPSLVVCLLILISKD